MLENVTEAVDRKIAVLIDADNASFNLVQQVITEVSKYGKITTRRAYADWTSPYTKGWKEVVNQYAITPMQQFAFAVGKNATDSFMIIDAMDLLHSRKVDGFAIISSDSDFTRLATRIREEGLFVMGIGRKLSTQAFVNACEVFVYTEVLEGASLDGNQSSDRTIQKEETSENLEIDVSTLTVPKLKDMLREKGLSVSGKKADLIERLETHPTPKKSIDNKDYADAEKKIVSAMRNATEEWVALAPLGIWVRRLYPDFDSRIYGHKRLSDLIIAIPGLEYRQEGTLAHVRILSKSQEEE